MEIKKTLKKIQTKIFGSFKVNKFFSRADFKRLKKYRRYAPLTINFLSKKFNLVDALTFLSSYHEIFETGIYEFKTTVEKPIIIDCGANIGLATVFFKNRYPNAEIVAFEPDPAIFKALQENVSSLGYENVICKNQAVSNTEGQLSFKVEGGHSGMLTSEPGTDNIVKVEAIRLKSFLNNYKHITFLKIDIEGEECNVIPDIADELKKVDFLFLEYHTFTNKPQELGNIFQIIEQAGMRYYIKEAVDKSSPFINREIFWGMDMLINIFCFRN